MCFLGQSDFLDEDSNDVITVPESPTSSIGINSSPSSPVHFSKKPRLELKPETVQPKVEPSKLVIPGSNNRLANSGSGKKKTKPSQAIKRPIQYASDNSDDDFL